MYRRFATRARAGWARWYVSAFLLAAFPGTVLAQDAAQPPSPRSSRSAAQLLDVGDEPGGLLDEPRFIAKGIELGPSFTSGGEPEQNGFYPEFSNMITGSGVISVGPGYRHTVFGGTAFFETSAAVSWHAYT